MALGAGTRGKVLKCINRSAWRADNVSNPNTPGALSAGVFFLLDEVVAPCGAQLANSFPGTAHCSGRALRQLSIRRPILESLTLCLPSPADQQRIVALAALAKQERYALQQLLRNRDQQFQALAESMAASAQSAYVTP